MKNLVILLFFVPFFAAAQTTHKVAAKETLYSLARKYNVHPRELAAYNNIPVETGLTLGQVIRIPAKTTMAPLNVPAPAKSTVVEKAVPEPKPVAEIKNTTTKPEGSFPIYHKVAKKETLYHISKLYSNASIEDIKKWNKLTSDALSEGVNLIVGYTKTKSAGNLENENSKPATPVVAEKPATKEVVPVVKETETQKSKEPEVVAKTEPVKEAATNITGKDFKGGVFKNVYSQQVSAKKEIVEERGTAGSFKSTSGWEDGKYYCLSNDVPAGTIVKVTYTLTQKSVYAKVLDIIPDLKQNTGIVLRISNAAAQELGAGNENFECTINY